MRPVQTTRTAAAKRPAYLARAPHPSWSGGRQREATIASASDFWSRLGL